MQLSAYLSFDGQCRQAFEFYAEQLGGEIKSMLTYADSPADEQLPAAFADRIMHASLHLPGQILMGSDARPGHYSQPVGFSLEVGVADADADAAQRLFLALSQGGDTRLALQETFWAEQFGMLVDRFGIPWTINCDKPG